MSILEQSDRLAKLGRLMLDGGATASEAESAAVQFCRAARKAGVTFDHLCGTNDLILPPCASLNIHFGKYSGSTLADIVSNDPGYLLWMAREMTNLRPPLRDAVDAMVCWLLGRESAW